MTVKRPVGVSLIALLFLVEAVAAVGVAAMLILNPLGSSSISPLLQRLDLPLFWGGLLAIPPLLTAAMAGLIFRGLWEAREWARLAGIVFWFLVSLFAIISAAFLFTFEQVVSPALLSSGLVFVLAVICVAYLVVATPRSEVAVDQQGKQLAAEPEQAFTAPPPPPGPAQQQTQQLVPPPGSPLASDARHDAPTIAVAAALDTQRIEQKPNMSAAIAPVAWLVVRQGVQVGQQFEIYPERDAVIGRDPAQASIVLADMAVSSRHSCIRSQAGVFTLEDLGSTNGTFVDEEKVQKYTLSNGNVIRVGRTSLRFSTSKP